MMPLSLAVHPIRESPKFRPSFLGIFFSSSGKKKGTQCGSSLCKDKSKVPAFFSWYLLFFLREEKKYNTLVPPGRKKNIIFLFPKKTYTQERPPRRRHFVRKRLLPFESRVIDHAGPQWYNDQSKSQLVGKSGSGIQIPLL